MNRFSILGLGVIISVGAAFRGDAVAQIGRAQHQGIIVNRSRP